jgi:beta-glucanase (GH16 family)
MKIRSIVQNTLFLGLVSSAFWACIEEKDGLAADLNLPVLNIENQTVTEGDQDQTIDLKVTLQGTIQANVVVKFAAVAGSAKESEDYEVLSTGQLVFEPGEKEKIVRLNIVGDELKETRETFEVKLFNPTNGALGNDVATITVEDDDDNTAGISIPSGGFITPTSYPGYNLVWADEFNGTELNTSDWTFELGDGCPNLCGWGNNELQYYRQDNTSFVNGCLVITAKRQQFGNREYTSSRLITKGKRQFKFGRIDIRAALPKGQGLWPALWMLGSNIDAVGWPACGEIDIMELTGNIPNRVLGTVHFGANLSQHQYITGNKYLDGNANFQDEFHVFSLNWVADKIEFLVDNQVYHTITPASVGNAPYPFNKNFFFIFNVAVGGNLPGSPDNSTPFPQRMIVDYVRVFQP